MSARSHPYHPMCGCWLCCEVEEAEERADEPAPQLDPVFAALLAPWTPPQDQED